MAALKIILTILFVIVCVALAAIVLLQEGKSNGLGAISGAAETYWGKNKGRSMEGKLEKGTKLLVIAFFVFAILLNIPSITGTSTADASTTNNTSTVTESDSHEGHDHAEDATDDAADVSEDAAE